MSFGFVHPAHSIPSHRRDSACPDHHATDGTRCGQCLGHRRTSTPTVELVNEPRPTQQWSRQMSAPLAPHCRRSQRARRKPHPRRSRSSPNRHRKANPSSRRHGLLAAAAESAAPSTTPRAKNRAPGQTSPCVERRGHVPFAGRIAALIRCARHRFVGQVVGVDLLGGFSEWQFIPETVWLGSANWTELSQAHLEVAITSPTGNCSMRPLHSSLT
jgi:hypothetical protein